MMQDRDKDSIAKKVIHKLTHFDWLSTKHAARGREAVLHGLSFFMALVLLAAGYGQLAAYPFWSAVTLSLFGFGYAGACQVFQDSLYVYPTLALWTVAFFLLCFAAGASPLFFPLVATALIWILWLVAGIAGRRQPDFETACHRCVFFTTVIFGVWALCYNAGHPEVPATAFLLYGFSLAFFNFRKSRSLYGYCSGVYLAIGSFYTALSCNTPWQQYGVAVQFAAFLIIILAIVQYESRKDNSSQAHFFTGLLLTFVCILWSLAGARFLLDQLALTAATLGLIALLWRADSTDPDSSGTEDCIWKNVLYMISQGALFTAIPFIIIGPLLSLGHLPSAVLVLALLSLGNLLYLNRGGLGKSIAISLHQASFLTALACAWVMGAVYSNAEGPEPLGIAVAALLWLVVWLYQKVRGLKSHSSVTAGCQAGIAAALILMGTIGNRWDAHICYAAAVVLTCSLVMLLIEKGFLQWLAAAISASLMAAALAGLYLTPVQQCSTIWILSMAVLIAALVTRKKADSSLVLSSVSLSLTLPALSAALYVTEPISSVFCLAAAMGIPIVLAALYLQQKRILLMLAVAVLNIVGTGLLLWTGRLVSLMWLGSAVMLLCPFLALGWIVSGFWMYASATAAALALGLLVAIGSIWGLNWGLMLVVAALSCVFLHVHSCRGDELCRSSISAVGHLLALLLLVLLYILADQNLDWRIALSLIAVGLVYWSVSRRAPASKSTSRLFFSLSLVPLIALFYDQYTGFVLLIPALLVPTWAVAGLVERDTENASGCRTSAMLGLMLCLLGSTRIPDPSGTLFVICLAGLLICLITQRKRLYVQLILVVLALLGYAWIRQSGSHFTQELYFYLLLILGLATAAELSPYLTEYFDRAVPVPYVRLFTWRGIGFGALAGMAAALVCVGGFALGVTEHPIFCTSCHNMGEFFASWQHSSHKEVACVECHYEPGFVSHVEGKIGAISQVASFVTHRYGAKPHAEVSNKSCQRSGCHETIEKNTDVFFQKRIHFDHSIHHDAMVPGRSLPCTICHAQEIQSKHISISSNTCFLCHFYGEGAAVQMTEECTSCHGSPTGAVAVGDSEFSHTDFFEGQDEVDCKHCHRVVNSGEGQASTVRCQSCHYGEMLDTVAEDQVEDLHERHVHDHKVSCFDCHGIIKHGIATKATAGDAKSCNTCHIERQHLLQAKMALGQAVPDLPGEPNVMYSAGISCTHCHEQEQQIPLGERKFTTHIATGKICADCHGGDESYEEVFNMWQEDTDDALKELTVKLSAVSKRLDTLAGSNPSDQRLPELKQHLVRAQKLYNIVARDGSHGVHNPDYTDTILETASEELTKINEALKDSAD